MILSLLVLVLLCMGSYQDIKSRTIDNKISFTIVALCIPLILLNLHAITVTHIVVAGVILIATIYRMYGPADMRVMIPLIFSLPKIDVVVFFVVVSIVAGILFVKYKKEVPFFVAITAGYVVAIIV